MTTLVADHPGGAETRHDRNKERIANPQPGDYWHEMFCPYFVVVAAEGDQILICDKRVDVGRDRWTWDISQCRYATKAELRERVTYSTMPDGFCADCSPKSHAWVVDAYAELTREPTFADLYQ
jgi:hypothetical protein